MKTTAPFKKKPGHDLNPENTVLMKLDEESNHILMDVLSKLYTHPARAVLRELLSNALDACEGLEGTAPIEVRLPTEQDQTLVVRDFGPGVSKEQFSEVLSRYGASTRRATNSYRGGFGFGLKSAYSLADQFEIVSYQKGFALPVQFRKNEQNLAYLQFDEPFPTSEPDGTRVSVKVPKSNLSEVQLSKLLEIKFLAGYDPAQVHFFEGEVLAPFNEVSVHNPEKFIPLKVLDDVVGWVEKTPTFYKKDGVFGVIGGVTYPLIGMDTIAPYLKDYKHKIYLNIPIGNVDIPSSRESLTYSERTINTLKSLIEDFRTTLLSEWQKQMNSLSRMEALEELDRHIKQNYFDASYLNWRGEQIPHPRSLTNVMFLGKNSSYSETDKFPNGHNNETLYSVLGQVGKWKNNIYTLFIDAFNPSTTKPIVDLFKDFNQADAKEEGKDYFYTSLRIIQTGHPSKEWFAEGTVITFEEYVEKAKEYRRNVRRAEKEKEKVAAKETRKYHMLDMKGVTPDMRRTGYFYAEAPSKYPSRKKVYISKVEHARDHVYTNLIPSVRSSGAAEIDHTQISALKALSLLIPDVLVCFIPANLSIDKFKQENPDAVNIKAVVNARIMEEWAKYQSGEESSIIKSVIAKTMTSTHRRDLSSFQEIYRRLGRKGKTVDVLPEDIQEVAQLMGNSNSTHADHLRLFFVSTLDDKDYNNITGEGKKWLGLPDKYPLLAYPLYTNSVLDEVEDAVVDYLQKQDKEYNNAR